jgi:hypothetical protein
VHGLAWCAEKPQAKTYVAHGIVFNETDNEQTILDNINKLIIKRSVDRSVSCCNESMSITKLQTHLINHHSKREGYSCPDCSYVSTEARYVKNHYLQVHQRLNLYTCPKCSKILKSHETLKVHAVRCLPGILSTTRAIRNDKITLALNEKINTLAPDSLSKYKINFKNLRDLIVCLKNNKIGRYYHCPFKSCINSNTDIDDVISCSLKHLDNEVFTCPNCLTVKDTYEKLKTHYQTCNESLSQASTEENSQESMTTELITVNPQEQTVCYGNSIPQYGSDQLHPSDMVMQRVTSNILNAPFGREDKTLTDREKLVMILAQRLESQK